MLVVFLCVTGAVGMGTGGKGEEGELTVRDANVLVEVDLGVVPAAAAVFEEALERGALQAEVLGLFEHVVHDGEAIECAYRCYSASAMCMLGYGTGSNRSGTCREREDPVYKGRRGGGCLYSQR